MRRSLEALEILHRSGYSHNALSTESMWLTSTNQQNINTVSVKLADLGSCQKLDELGPAAKEAVFEDLYQLGFIFLELIISSFSDDNLGAQYARSLLGMVTIMFDDMDILRDMLTFSSYERQW